MGQRKAICLKAGCPFPQWGGVGAEEESAQEAVADGQVSQDLPFERVSLCPPTFSSSYQPGPRDTTLFPPKEPWLPPSWNRAVPEEG